MRVRLNREIKHHCSDFRPVRALLRQIDATLAERKRQVDYFFNLPTPGPRSRRLKLRTEPKGSDLIYYYDRHRRGSRWVEFQVFPVRDPSVKQLLVAALGVRAIVRKRREVWKKGNALFHLDQVAGVGKVFEVELQTRPDVDVDHQLAQYKRLFGPHLGRPIGGSNEDLIVKRKRRKLRPRQH